MRAQEIGALRTAVEQAGTELAWLGPQRRKAFERFSALGFPTTQDEDWRYTDLGEAAAHAGRSPCEPAPSIEPELREKLAPLDGALRVLARCGRFDPPAGPSLAGVRLTTFGAMTGAGRERIAARIAEGPPAFAGDPLVSLNAALLRDGLHIEIEPGAVIEEPIYVVIAGGGESASYVRVLVDLGAGASATLIEHHIGTGPALSGTVTDVRCGRGSALSYLKLQDCRDEATHLAAQGFVAAEASRLELLHLDLGARLARNDLTVRLEGSAASVAARGLFYADGSRHLDNHTRVDHIAAGTTSRELYRGIADGRGRGVFNGKVIVHAGAGGTDARLSSENLLLSPTAEIDTKPELEIYADDVKCSHGATTGQLDANAIFYLRTRGIPVEQARRMLIASFAREIVHYPALPGLDAYLVSLVTPRLPDLSEVSVGP